MSLPFDKAEHNLAREVPFGAFRSSSATYPSNRIVTRKFTWDGFLPEAASQVFRNLGYLWLLLICAVEAVVIQANKDTGDPSTFVVFGAALLYAGVREVLLESQRAATDRSTNSVRCRVWSGSEFLEVRSGEVLCGDLLLVSNGETLVADAVLFTTEHPDGLSYVDNSQTLGTAEMTLKHAVPDVQRFMESSSVERLASTLPKVQGLIRTETPNQDFNTFHGNLKLIRSPAAVPLTMDNFILRGSRVFGAAWVVCCVVGTGMETKVMLKSVSSRRPLSVLEKSMILYARVAIAATILLAVANIIGFRIMQRAEDGSAIWPFLQSLSLFHKLLPPMVYVMFDLVRLLQTAIFKHFSPLKNEVTLSPFTYSSRYGQVDYIVADKNCAFTVDRPHVNTIIFRDKLFTKCDGYDEGVHTCSGVVRRQRNKAVVHSRTDEMRLISRPAEGTSTSTKSQSRLREPSHESCGFRTLEDKLSLGGSDELVRLFECMVLCNTIAQLDPLKAKTKFEEAIVACAERFGFKLLESGGDRTLLEIMGTRVVYKVIASSESSKSLKCMRSIVERSDSPGGTLFLKGPIGALGQLLKMEEEMFERIRANELELKQQGLVPILLACRQIGEEELDVVKDKMWKAQSSAISTHSRVEAVFSELEHDLQYLGIICLEDPLPTETADGVEKLQKAGIKLWIVSSDSETESLASCMRAGFFDDENYVVPIKGLDDCRECARRLSNLVAEFIYKRPLNISWTEEASAMITPKTQRVAPSLERLVSEIVAADTTTRRYNNKDILRHSFDHTTLNFVLLVDGTSFDTALLQEDTQQYLAALLFTARVVCFFNTLPHQKAKIIRFLKHSFTFSPTVLTFADGLSSIPMLNESDMKVGLEREASAQSNYMFDVKVKSLRALGDFLILAGRANYRRIRDVLMFVLYENVLIVSVLVAYAGLCGFTVNSPIDSQSIWAITIIATKPLILFIGLRSEDIHGNDAEQYPEVYRWRSRDFAVYRFLLKGLLTPALHGTAISVLSFIGLKTMTSPDGFTEDYSIISGFLSVLVFLSIVADIVTNSHQCVNLWAAVVCSASVYALEVALFNYTDGPLSGSISSTFSQPSAIFRIVLCSLFVATVSIAQRWYRDMFLSKLLLFVAKKEGQNQRVKEYEMALGRVWKQSNVWAPPKSQDVFERRTLLRTYKLLSMERNFEISIFPEVIRHIQAGLLILSLLACVVTAVSIYHNSTPKYHALRVLFTAYSLLMFASTFTNFYRTYYILINKSCVVILSFSLGLYQILSGNSYSEVAISLPILFFLCFYISLVEVAVVTIVNVAVFVSVGVFNILLSNDSFEQGFLLLLEASWEVLGVSAAAVLAGYFIDDISREKFKLLTTKENDLEKADNILKYLLPEFVRARVKDGVRFIAEAQPCVHILFCEICNFDHLIKDYEAMEVTSLLNKIYEKFDELCETCGVTKVETVGKVYMACAGVNGSESGEQQSVQTLAIKILHFGFEIITAMDQFRLPDGEHVKIKVGIHSGQVIAGVVGFHKPQFSLVGDAVNTASRMCSTVDEENTVQISSASYEWMKDAFGVLFDCQTKDIKGKGRMEVYTVWRDIGSRSLRVDADTPQISPELSSRRALVSRGMTLLRRGSVFEASSDVSRSIRKNNPRKSFWKMCHLQLVNSKFYYEMMKLRQPVAILGLLSVLILSLIDVGLKGAAYSFGYIPWPTLFTRTLVCILLLLLFFLSHWIFTQRCFSWVALLLLLCTVVCYFADTSPASITYNFSSSQSMTILMVLSAVHFTGLRSFQLLPLILLTAGLCTVAFVREGEMLETELRWACVSAELLIFMVYAMHRDVRLEKFFELKQAVTAEIAKTDDLLANLLPQHILENMKLEQAVTDHLEDTTLLVADIVGFTSWSNEREPSEVIEMLSNLFSSFDKLCLIYKTYKVYTIGDCYIAMGFSGSRDSRNPRQECVNVVLMAEEMKKVIAQVNDDYFTDLNMRIGIHTGEIIGAIIGTNIVRYDIYGRDVLIAFKMEANSEPGQINVSEASRRLLEDADTQQFSFTDNKVVDISAIGEKVKCYFTTLREESRMYEDVNGK